MTKYVGTTVGTMFYAFEGASPATAYQIYGVMTKPPLPGTPSRINATSQEDTHSKDKMGVIQLAEPTVQFKYAKHDANTLNYDKWKDLQATGEAIHCGIKYPDGGAVEWKGKPFAVRDGNGVDALDTFTVHFFEVHEVDDDAAPPENITLVTGV